MESIFLVLLLILFNMFILSQKYFLQIKTNSIQWTTHSFVVYSFNITTFIKRQYLHLSGCSRISLFRSHGS